MTAPRETDGEGRHPDVTDAILAIANEVCTARYWLHPDSEHHNVHTCNACRYFAETQVERALATPRPVEVTEGRPEAFTDEVAGWTTHDSTLSVRYHGASADLLTLFIEQSPLPTNGGPARRTTVKRSALLAALRAQPAGEADDDDGFADKAAGEILCRVFDGYDYDAAFAEWQAFDKSGWFSWPRAFGAFLAGRLKGRAQPAGGTPCPLSTHGPFCEPSHMHPAPVADAGGTPEEGYDYRALYDDMGLTQDAAPTLPPVGERGEIARRIDRLCNSANRDVQRIGAELAKLHYRLDPMNVEHDLDDEISIALIIAKVNALATRPSPAPSGERPIGEMLAEVHQRLTERQVKLDPVARDILYQLAAAPHPDGQGERP